MTIELNRAVPAGGLGALLAGILAGGAAAHVELDTPNGGETLTPGSTFTITWHVLIEHNTVDWDLWYSTTGPDGPWIDIAVDLPPGDPTADSVHTHEWTVPPDVSDEVRVRVRQENTASEYYDVSDADLSIVLQGDANDDGVVNVGDLIEVIVNWGPCPAPPATCSADFDGNGVVNVLDLNDVILNWSS